MVCTLLPANVSSKSPTNKRKDDIRQYIELRFAQATGSGLKGELNLLSRLTKPQSGCVRSLLFSALEGKHFSLASSTVSILTDSSFHSSLVSTYGISRDEKGSIGSFLRIERGVMNESLVRQTWILKKRKHVDRVTTIVSFSTYIEFSMQLCTVSMKSTEVQRSEVGVEANARRANAHVDRAKRSSLTSRR